MGASNRRECAMWDEYDRRIYYFWKADYWLYENAYHDIRVTGNTLKSTTLDGGTYLSLVTQWQDYDASEHGWTSISYKRGAKLRFGNNVWIQFWSTSNTTWQRDQIWAKSKECLRLADKVSAKAGEIGALLNTWANNMNINSEKNFGMSRNELRNLANEYRASNFILNN